MTLERNQSENRLSAALRELATTSPRGASPEGGLMLMEAFRRHHLRRKRIRNAGIGLFTLCLACLVASFLLWRSSPATGSGDVRTVHTIPPEEVGYSAEISAARRTPRHSIPPRRNSPNPSAPAATGAFVALPSLAVLSPGAELRVVRLEMRGEDLRLVGAPVIEEISARRITADFVVGHDGTPYAVRLVRSNF